MRHARRVLNHLLAPRTSQVVPADLRWVWVVHVRTDCPPASRGARLKQSGSHAHLPRWSGSSSERDGCAVKALAGHRHLPSRDSISSVSPTACMRGRQRGSQGAQSEPRSLCTCHTQTRADTRKGSDAPPPTRRLASRQLRARAAKTYTNRWRPWSRGPDCPASVFPLRLSS